MNPRASATLTPVMRMRARSWLAAPALLLAAGCGREAPPTAIADAAGADAATPVVIGTEADAAPLVTRLARLDRETAAMVDEARSAIESGSLERIQDAELAMVGVRELGRLWCDYAAAAGHSESWIADQLAAIGYRDLLRQGRRLREQRVILENRDLVEPDRRVDAR